MFVSLYLVPLYTCYTNTYYQFYTHSVELYMEQFINYSQVVVITQSCPVIDKEINTQL